MPSTLASRAALFVLTATFLIPIWTSALGGLTHVLSCREEVRTPFSLLVQEDREATVISATTVKREEAEEEEAEGALFSLCGGLTVLLEGRPAPTGQVEMAVSVTNETRHPWQGTILFHAGTTPIPVGIGNVDPEATETDVVRFDLEPGQHELTGSLLIGP